MKIYLIPGLGYDDRIFGRLNFEGLDVNYINWIEPKSNELILEYAKRLFANIEKPPKEKIILIGHSFGAVVSQEIATIKDIHKIILISSIKSSKELSRSFRMINWLKLYVFFTKEISIKTIPYWGKNHGFETAEDQSLFKKMLSQQSNTYLQWALKTLSSWQSPTIPSTTQLIHIHGTKDKTLPYNYINKPHIEVENGSHIMVYKQAKLINEIILKAIENS